MPDDSVPELLAGAACEVLETMFFTCPLGDAESGAAGEDPFHARVAFKGKHSGIFGLSVDGPSALAITSNFLGSGDEGEIAPEQVEDVVCELANIICGTVLSRIDSAARFDIGHPELAAAAVEGPYERSLALDDGTLTVSLGFE
jgi:CheY-specific phosphatase CheX